MGEGQALIKELREKTGAGIMDCKRALVASDNSVDQAIKLLREKGLAAAQRREGRSPNEGTRISVDLAFKRSLIQREVKVFPVPQHINNCPLSLSFRPFTTASIASS